MADITACVASLCNRKEKCYRFTCKKDEWQSYSDFSLNVDPKIWYFPSPAFDCKYFWSNDGYDNEEKSKRDPT